jgi:hypothetical protein
LLISHVITLVPFRVSSVDPSPFPKADNLSIANQSWARYKRGVSGWSWDIGQVPLRNFDWLPFTPPLVAFSGPLKTNLRRKIKLKIERCRNRLCVGLLPAPQYLKLANHALGILRRVADRVAAKKIKKEKNVVTLQIAFLLFLAPSPFEIQRHVPTYVTSEV